MPFEKSTPDMQGSFAKTKSLDDVREDQQIHTTMGIASQNETASAITQSPGHRAKTHLAPIFRRGLGAQSSHSDREGRGTQKTEESQEHIRTIQYSEEDPNQSRRKRQKLSAVEAHDLCAQHQPEGEAAHVDPVSRSPFMNPASVDADSSNFSQVPRYHRVQESASNTQFAVGIPLVSPQQAFDSNMNTSFEGDTIPLSASMDGTSDRKTENGPHTPKKTRVPKKMLQINANGKLLSSPHRSTAQQVSASPTNPKPTRVKNGSKKSKLVIFKYKSGCESSIGERIAQILASNGKMAINRDQTTTQPKASKPTHPFFLGRNKDAVPIPENVSQPEMQLHGEGGQKATVPITSTISRPSTKQSMTTFNSRLQEMGSQTPKSTTYSRNPDVLPPIWPPKDLRIEQSSLKAAEQTDIDLGRLRRGLRKSKQAVAGVLRDENILTRMADTICAKGISRSSGSSLRLPRRAALSGRECLDALYGTKNNSSQTIKHPNSHPAIQNLRSLVPRVTTTFDAGKCDNLSWTTKYAPTKAEEVLQSGREAVFLRDWIKSLTVTTVQTGSSTSASERSRVPGKLRRKRRRNKKLDDDLDGFVVSTDDEADELLEESEDELTLPNVSGVKRSAFRNSGGGSRQASQEPSKNAVLLSGPHGCGKTASVYAVSRELGFEIFEINPGSRRSAKDIFDRVGDMTQNHLVQRRNSETGPSEESVSLDTEDVQKEIASGRQGTMTSFFKIKSSAPAPKTRGQSKAVVPVLEAPPTQPRKSQMQSLILIEEADVLFEEDKTFWNAVLSLCSQSKRPIIITCSDETLIPFEELSLEAILRYTSISSGIAAEYLVTLAAAEGHVIGEKTAMGLYNSRGHDLRASMMDLNFWCQMAVGSNKGSLDWMFDAQKENQYNDLGERLRTTSIGTYDDDMSLIPRHLYHSDPDVGGPNIEDLMRFSDDELEISITDWFDGHAIPMITELDSHDAVSRLTTVSRLSNFMSDLDILDSTIIKKQRSRALDSTYPELSPKSRTHYCEGYPLLETFERPDYIQTPSKIAAAFGSILFGITKPSTHSSPKSFIISQIYKQHARPQPEHNDRITILQALLPLEASPPVFPPPPPGRTALSLEPLVSTSVVANDIAPYVRYIIGYDRRLEQMRGALSSSQEGDCGSGTESKRKAKIRTTRASRAALEGGRKDETRRENWFHKKLDIAEVMKTGGEKWQDLLLKEMDKDDRNEMRNEQNHDTSMNEA